MKFLLANLDKHKTTLIFFVFYFVNVALRLPCLFQDNLPFTFGDENIVVSNSYSLYYDKTMRPGQFLYGGFNYYLPALLAYVFSLITKIHITYEVYTIYIRFLFAVLISGLFPSIVYLSTKKLFNDNKASILSALFATFSPMALGLSRFAYPDHYVVTFSSLILLFCAHGVSANSNNNTNSRFLIIASVYTGIGIGIKYYCILFVPFIIICDYLRSRLTNQKILIINWIKYSLAITISFLITNPYVLIEPLRFWKDFNTNMANYQTGFSGAYANNGISMYFQYIYFTSFGICGGIITIFSYINLLKTNRPYLVILLFIPMIFIFNLGLYQTNIARNMMPTLPFVFVAMGFGFLGLISKFKSVAAIGLLVVCICIEPLAKVFTSIYEDTLPDSRIESEAWIQNNVLKKSTIGIAKSSWGTDFNLIGFKTEQLVYGHEMNAKNCLDYFLIDGWLLNVHSEGQSMYSVMNYSKMHYSNPSRQSMFTEEKHPKHAHNRFIETFKLIKEFSSGFYGPAIFIYKNNFECSNSIK